PDGGAPRPGRARPVPRHPDAGQRARPLRSRGAGPHAAGHRHPGQARPGGLALRRAPPGLRTGRRRPRPAGPARRHPGRPRGGGGRRPPRRGHVPPGPPRGDREPAGPRRRGGAAGRRPRPAGPGAGGLAPVAAGRLRGLLPRARRRGRGGDVRRRRRRPHDRRRLRRLGPGPRPRPPRPHRRTGGVRRLRRGRIRPALGVRRGRLRRRRPHRLIPNRRSFTGIQRKRNAGSGPDSRGPGRRSQPVGEGDTTGPNGEDEMIDDGVWRTEAVERLGIRLPVVGAPMGGGPSTPALVAAVSEAGGLGSLAVGYLSPDRLRSDIAAVREATAKPFAVNLFVPSPAEPTGEQIEAALAAVEPFRMELGLPARPTADGPWAEDFDAQLQAVVDARVPVVSFTFGLLPAAAVAALHDAGSLLVGTATTVEEAVAVEASGADLVCAQGAEAGAHRGTFLGRAEQALIGTLALVPQVCDAVGIPVLAAGGIMDGRGVAAVLGLGA